MNKPSTPIAIAFYKPPKVAPKDAHQFGRAAVLLMWGIAIVLVLTGNGFAAAMFLLGWIIGVYSNLMQMLGRRVGDAQ